MRCRKWRAVILACAAALMSGVSGAQDFPVRPVRIIVPFPPAGVADILGRVLAPPLSRALGQSVIVENRPGANTVIGAELLARAPADGHVLLIIAPSFTINATARTKLPYDSLKDFSGVTRIASTAMVISVHPSLPARTLKELVALARSRPGELTFATASILGGQRLAAEQFADAARIRLTNVPYNGGGPAATAAVGGHTMMLVVNVAEVATQIEAGKLRAIAVTTLARSDVLKDVPTIAESGYPGFEATNWFGAVARSATPRSAIDRLGAEIGRALKQREVKDTLGRQGLSPAATTPAEFDVIIRREMEVNGRIIRRLNLKVE
jgi:tripartite-type tricarboxylate transporter receptor subunit TctC